MVLLLRPRLTSGDIVNVLRLSSLIGALRLAQWQIYRPLRLRTSVKASWRYKMSTQSSQSRPGVHECVLSHVSCAMIVIPAAIELAGIPSASHLSWLRQDTLVSYLQERAPPCYADLLRECVVCLVASAGDNSPADDNLTPSHGKAAVDGHGHLLRKSAPSALAPASERTVAKRPWLVFPDLVQPSPLHLACHLHDAIRLVVCSWGTRSSNGSSIASSLPVCDLYSPDCCPQS
ncbi:hypothetical protein BASA62_008380 [Batrachochytrium salamandrivorans]|nr:hypothetical protein BASA62_008380 [Batrachochytrium salamandrivorans]